MQQNGSRFGALNAEDVNQYEDNNDEPSVALKTHASKPLTQVTGSKATPSPNHASSKKNPKTQAQVKTTPKDKGKGIRKDPVPKTDQPKIVVQMDHGKPSETLHLDPVAREQRAQRELQMLREMQRIQRQHFSNPTGSIVDLLYGSLQSKGEIGTTNDSGDIMEDVIMEGTRPPDPSAGDKSTGSPLVRGRGDNTGPSVSGVSSSS